MTTDAENKFLTIVREFDAPRDLVWTAWTDTEHAMRWYGPEHFTCPVYESDFRVGGRYHLCMRSADGQDFWSGGEFKEIVPPERLVSSDFFSDAEGNPIDPAEAGMPEGMPKIMDVEITFEVLEGNRTRLTIAQSIPQELAKTIQADVGWISMLNKLELYLADQQAR